MHAPPLTIGSLFSGIGGFELGLEATGGFRTLWQCEIDPYARAILARHWPDVTRHGDITQLTDPAPVDVLCGGFPCQDISYAGKGGGIGAARSGLWSEYARLIGLLRPRYAIVENVPALLSRGLEVVLADLLALGYDAEWDCIPASALGAPHRRDRIWIVAYPHELGRRDPSRPLPDAGGDGRQHGQHRPEGYEGQALDRARDAGEQRRAEGGIERRGLRGAPGGDREALADPDLLTRERCAHYDLPSAAGRHLAEGRHADRRADSRGRDADAGDGNLAGGRAGGDPPQIPDRRWRPEDAALAASERAEGERQPADGGRGRGAGTLADPEKLTLRTGLRENGSSGQRRRRSGDSSGAGGDVPDPEGERRRPSQSGRSDRAREGTSEQPSPWTEAGWPGSRATFWSSEPDVGRVADGIPARLDRLTALGNAIVPQIAEYIGWRILHREAQLEHLLTTPA